MAGHFPLLNDRAWLETQILQGGDITRRVADTLKCTTAAARYAFKKFKLVVPQPYSQLRDQAWLEDQYVNKRLATTDIARIIGCSKDAVRKCLLDFGVTLRSTQDSRVASLVLHPPTSKYPLLNDPVWLRQEYITKKRSVEELAGDAGCKNHNSVCQSLSRFGIPIRSVSAGLTRHRTTVLGLDEELITGCLLGDGFMQKYNKNSVNSHATFHKKNKFYDHVLWCAEQLLGPTAASYIEPETSVVRGTVCTCSVFRTPVFPSLDPYFEAWYPAPTRIKVVPRHIVITPKVLLHWFLDDGSARYSGPHHRKPAVVFCCESFTYADQVWLTDEICKLGIQAYVKKYNQGTGWRIGIRAASIPDFFKLIGPPPVASLAYKWLQFLPVSSSILPSTASSTQTHVPHYRGNLSVMGWIATSGLPVSMTASS